MKTISTYPKESYSPYPGEYKPLFPDRDEKMANLCKENKWNCEPSANISEYADHYMVEIIAPGHSKDDFMVDIDKNKLSVFAIRHEPNMEETGYRLHEFNFEYFSQSIELPGNIDADFIAARYRSGILSICFPKTLTPSINTVHNIIVY